MQLHRGLDRLGFDLERGPVLRTVLVREAAESHVLHLSVHHIAADGWSFELLLAELGAFYGELSGVAEGAGAPSAGGAELAVQYGDYAAWQRDWLRGAVRERQLAYWRERLAGAPDGGSELPLDRPRPAVQTFRSGQRGLVLEGALAAGLGQLARHHEASLFMVLLAAFDLLLARLSGQEDVVVGTPVAGREIPEVEPLVGMFLNTLVLRTDGSGDPSFSELVARTRETALGAFGRQSVPFEMLLEDLAPGRDLSRTPLFQVFFNMFSGWLGDPKLPGLDVEVLDTPEAPSKFDLTLYVSTPGDGLRFEAVYNADLFDAATVERVLAQYRRVLEQAVADPAAAIGRYSLATAEAERVLPDPTVALDATWRGPVHEALRRQATAAPDRLAVVDPERSWTYGELAATAHAVARRLAAEGVGRGAVVAILAHRSAALVAGVLGVLEAGAAFALLDPAYPDPRLADMIELAAPKAILEMERAAASGPSRERFERALDEGGTVRFALPAAPETSPEGPPPVDLGPDDLAYVAFTSGSTGRPKAVAGRHGPLSHFLPWQCRTFGLSAGDRFSGLSGLAHDPLQRDLFTPLWLGACLVLPDPDALGEPGALAAWMERERVTVAHLTPAMGQLVAEVPASGRQPRLDSLRRTLLVGDALTRRDVARLRAIAPSVEVINLYGTTETQRAVGYYRLDEEHPPAAEVLPLGRGMEGCQLLVLAAGDRRAAVGEVGEIAVRSPHLAAGYLGDEELTARRFVRNPLTGLPDDRIYRTGDLGRYLADGSVAFLGRGDRQVKIRGFRIEPAEIEAQTAALPGVRAAVVLPDDRGPDGRRLVAYVAVEAGAEEPGRLAEDLRRRLGARLPGYMVPAAFVVLDRLPLTPNGKVDRQALQAMATPDEALPAAAPRTPLEGALAEAFERILDHPRVGIHDDFFSLGGHSILATRLASAVRDSLGIELPLRSVFEHPTVAGLAAWLTGPDGGVRSAAAGAAWPAPAAGEGRAAGLPLSFGQERLWFLDRLAPDDPSYTMAGAVRLIGELDLAALASALAGLLARHESLRTRFPERDGRPEQRIEETVRVPFRLLDLRGLPPAARQTARRAALGAALARPFDLARAPLVRCLVIAEAERRPHPPGDRPPHRRGRLVGRSGGARPVRPLRGGPRRHAGRPARAAGAVRRPRRLAAAVALRRAARARPRVLAPAPGGRRRCSPCPPTARGRHGAAGAAAPSPRRSAARSSPGSTGWAPSGAPPGSWCSSPPTPPCSPG